MSWVEVLDLQFSPSKAELQSRLSTIAQTQRQVQDWKPRCNRFVHSLPVSVQSSRLSSSGDWSRGRVLLQHSRSYLLLCGGQGERSTSCVHRVRLENFSHFSSFARSVLSLHSGWLLHSLLQWYTLCIRLRKVLRRRASGDARSSQRKARFATKRHGYLRRPRVHHLERRILEKDRSRQRSDSEIGQVLQGERSDYWEIHDWRWERAQRFHEDWKSCCSKYVSHVFSYARMNANEEVWRSCRGNGYSRSDQSDGNPKGNEGELHLCYHLLYALTDEGSEFDLAEQGISL